jgi:Ca2+-binding RTX toxin-like protein
VLQDSAGNDTLAGGSNNDVLTGGEGNDVLTGDSGKDRFVFESGFGHDRIQTTIIPNFGQVQAASQYVGDDVIITVDTDNVLIPEGELLANLQRNHFAFI